MAAKLLMGPPTREKGSPGGAEACLGRCKSRVPQEASKRNKPLEGKLIEQKIPNGVAVILAV